MVEVMETTIETTQQRLARQEQEFEGFIKALRLHRNRGGKLRIERLRDNPDTYEVDILSVRDSCLTSRNGEGRTGTLRFGNSNEWEVTESTATKFSKRTGDWQPVLKITILAPP